MARPNKPWYRGQKDAWYARIGGKQVSLGVRGEANRDEAYKAWHRFMADGPKPRPEPTAVPTVAQVIAGFLGDAEARLKPSTVRGYRDFLTPFQAKHGHSPADG